MRKLLIPAILLGAATVVAAPASAQYQYPRQHGYGHGYGQGQDIQMQLRQIDERIERLYARGRITRGEARSLSNELGRIANRFQDYRRNGLSPSEHQDLQRRIHNLREEVREDRRDGRRDRDWDDRRERRW